MIAAQNKEAEETVIGALLLGREETIDTVAELLEPDDFYADSLGTIYATILDLHAAGTPADAITVTHHLHETGRLDKAGGEDKVKYLAAIVPAASNVAHYAKIVRKAARMRRLDTAGMAITKLAREGVGDWDTILSDVELALTQATQSGRAANITPITEGFDEWLNELRQAYATGVANTGAPTGLAALDNALLGLWPGQLILVAARPGQGKSTIILNIAENFADRGEAVLFVTLEMSKMELQVRSLARAASADSMRLITGQLTPEEAQRLAAGITTVKGRECLHVEDEGDVTIQKLSATAARMKRQHDIRLIVVDYIQLMTATIRSDNRAEQIGSISRGLKLLARRLDIPVIAASQMNRKIEERKQPRPQLSDLRDSGTLEQDSDVVLFLHDDAAYDVDVQPNGEVEVIIAKNRRGSTGNAKLLYTRRYSKFHDMPLRSVA